MAKLVMGLLIAQILLGLYQLGFVLGAGQRKSHARATGLPDPIVVIHPAMALLATALWIGYLASADEVGFAWGGFAALVVAASGGTYMGIKTVTEPHLLAKPAALDPADARVAEKQIPGISLVLHTIIAILLLVFSLLVCLGVDW